MNVVSTPILLLIYNRPKHTQVVLDAIRQVKPKTLFVAADGPKAGDPLVAQLCEETRDVVTKGIDWACEVKYLFREDNLGCGNAVSSALDWFFQHVNAGIILEDDILPSNDFFKFCASMLTRYESDESIYSIGGFSCISGDETQTFHSSYIFSSYVQIWGWATWRRAWVKYRYQLDPTRRTELSRNLTNNYHFSFKERLNWIGIFDQQTKLSFNTWDYQWTFAVWLNKGKTIIPVNSLTQNIGFGIDATHTKGGDFLETIEISKMDEIVDPKSQSISKEYDAFMNQRVFGLNRSLISVWFSVKLKQLLREVLRRYLPK